MFSTAYIRTSVLFSERFVAGGTNGYKFRFRHSNVFRGRTAFCFRSDSSCPLSPDMIVTILNTRFNMGDFMEDRVDNFDWIILVQSDEMP